MGSRVGERANVPAESVFTYTRMHTSSASRTPASIPSALGAQVYNSAMAVRYN
jgi:hypothetical protein